MPECNPCQFCQNFRGYFDWSIGIEDDSCLADEEFAIEEIKPCPYFKAILPSDSLYEQLANEEEAELDAKYELEYKQAMEVD